VEEEMKAVGHYELIQNVVERMLLKDAKSDSFALSSYAFRFPATGSGAYFASVLKSKLPMFVQNCQRSMSGAFQRKQLAEKFGIRSILFVPTESGVLEMGSFKELRLLEGCTALNMALCVWTNNIANIYKYVEPAVERRTILEYCTPSDLSDKQTSPLAKYCNNGIFMFAVEWAIVDGVWVVINHYTPSWRVAQKLEQGEVSLYSLESYAIRLNPGKGSDELVLDTVAKERTSVFFENVQHRDSNSFKRLELAKKHSIRSCLYMPSCASMDSSPRATVSPTKSRGNPTVIELGTRREVKLREGSNIERVSELLHSGEGSQGWE